MRSLGVLAFAFAGLSAIVGSLAFAHHPHGGARLAVAAPAVQGSAPAVEAVSAPAATVDSPFSRLPAVRFTNQNTGQSADVRLYDESGHVDETAALRLDALLCDARDPKNLATTELDRRTLQLAVRAAMHFHVSELLVVSAYRKPGRRREGPHASGKAIDFKLPGVQAPALASYLRSLPRVGVGVYTHPKTSFVHLDDREHSFHWLDASPPGRHWRERSMGFAGLTQRDASYSRADDWPEGTSPPFGG